MSTILACVWPTGTIDDVEVEGLAYHTPYYLAVVIWGYCLFWWFVQDAAKVLAYMLMKRYNLFDINENGAVIYDEPTLEYMKEIEKRPLLSDHH
jgi:H+-transporting ATPase